ncbi:MAG: hypothetical protein ACFFDW_12410 [Candidatus Thorarchaeota archaeon]
MTIITWKCKVCGKEEDIPVFTFIDKCFSCNAEYELLGEATGIWGMSPLPIFKLKDESFDNEQLKNRLTLTFSTHAKEILCYSYDFHTFLTKEYSAELSAKNIILKMIKK